MNYFQDTVTNQVYAFNPDVIATVAAGVYSFNTASGARLNLPTTLQPCPNNTPPTPPTPPEVPEPLPPQAKIALTMSDTTMHRIAEAVVLGHNTWTGADVAAWVNYRRALRAIVDGSDTTSTTLPVKPAYPAGT
jgi:hypothetical protein